MAYYHSTAYAIPTNIACKKVAHKSFLITETFSFVYKMFHSPQLIHFPFSVKQENKEFNFIIVSYFYI